MKVENQKDSHKKSLSEALVNSFGGYPIGYGVGIVDFAALYGLDSRGSIHGKHCNYGCVCHSIFC